jgi:hypothetical protein
MKKTKLPEWAKYDTILGGVKKMQPVIDALKAELLAGRKAKREGKPKRVAYHTNRAVSILFNLDTHFWHPMFEWAQSESFWKEFNRRETPLQKALAKARKANAPEFLSAQSRDHE